MISRTFASILPRQSPSSLILASSTPDADSAGMVSFIYNSNLAPTLATLSVTCNLRTEAPSGLISSSEGWWQGNADWPARCGHSGWEIGRTNSHLQFRSEAPPPLVRLLWRGPGKRMRHRDVEFGVYGIISRDGKLSASWRGAWPLGSGTPSGTLAAFSPVKRSEEHTSEL